MDSGDASLFAAYGRSFYDAFQRTGDIADISKAKIFWKASVHLTPDGDANLAERLDNLGISLRCCFECTGNLDEVVEAISSQRKGLTLTPETDLDFPYRLMNLGNSLLRLSEHTGNLRDISEAISKQRRAIQIAPDDSAVLPSWLNNLSASLAQRFNSTGDLSDISEAIASQQRAVDLTPEDHPRLADRLSSLGSSLQTRFDRTGDLSDITRAVSLQQRAISLTDENDPGLPSLLHDLANSFTSRFERQGELSDISSAIISLQKAIYLTPDDHADLPMRLNSLGISLKLRFVHTGDLDDISAAISSQERAVRLTPPDHAQLPGRLNNLGTSYSRRFDSTHDLDDISKAILHQKHAINLTNGRHPSLPTQLSNLGASFWRRFEESGDLSDISEAITYQQKAVLLFPERHSTLPIALNNLGLSLWSRFKLTKDLNDISEAISSQQTAIAMTPEGHADLPTRLVNLGNSFSSRFEFTGDLHDAAEAIAILRRAVDLTPDDHAQMPLWLNALAISFIRRFENTAERNDISEAVSCHERAVRLTPPDSAKLPTFLNNLGLALMLRFVASEDLADISEAITAQQKAVRLTTEGHFNRPTQLMNLGKMFMKRFERTGDSADAQRATDNYRLAANSPSGSLADRLSSSREWAKLSHDFDPSQILRAWGRVIELASHTAGLEYTIQKRYEFLLNTAEISASAAAAAFAQGRPDLALEWLEQGRCLVWNQINNLRSPLSDLRVHDPTLADEVLKVSRELESAGSRAEPGAFTAETTMDEKVTLQEEVHAHVKLAQQWNELLGRVRAIPEFKNFLKPVPCSELMQKLPPAGFVVVINVHRDRSDALVLEKGLERPRHVHLADLSYADAEALRKALRDFLRYNGLSARGTGPDSAERGMRPSKGFLRTKARSTFTEILRQLWEFVAKPILDTLGLIEPLTTAERLPRVWWCATGPLAFLPIHAAGIYSERVSVALPDFVIPSYIPTVTSLIERVGNPRHINHNKKGLVLISQENTPGMSPLPGVTKEVNIIEQTLSAHNVRKLSLEGSSATVAKAMEEMQAHTCVHIACHAQQNIAEPLESGFYLSDGRLSLGTIIKNHLEGADFAFLAACQTSTGDEKLSEEAVHLAAGMLAAGFRGVIATMWSITDATAPKVAENFYLKLIGDIGQAQEEESQSEGLNGDAAAYALHYAMKELKRSNGNSDIGLLSWVPYVHFGL